MKYYGCPESSNTGAGMVGYKAIGTNTLLRTVEDKLNEILSSSGVTQDTLGVNELITNAILSGAGEVTFNSVISVNPATVTEKLTQVPLVGGGGIVNAYRKFVVPNYMAEYKPENTINPERHLRTFNNTSNPHVVIMGDSISTEGVDTYANTTSLWNNIKNKIIDDNPSKTITFTNRAIGGQAWTYADSVPTAFPAWYTNPVTPWLNYIEALNPDCVVLAFGMNDAAYFDATKLVSVVNKIKAWTKVPDIIFVTNPTPAQTTQFPDTVGTGFRGFEGQEGRDYVAEYVRGFAKANGYGFIDINRTLVAIRDSYDVVNGIMQHIGDDAPATGSFTGTWPANNFGLSGTMSGSVWSEGQTLEIKVGSHALDLIKITKTSGNFVITGSTVGTGVYKTINTSIAIPASDFGYDISVQNNKFTFIIDNTSNVLTTNKFVVGSFPIIRHGGIYFPIVKWQGLSTGNLVTLRYSSTYGSPQYKQTATDAEIWGVSDMTASIKPSFGGNGINHFTSKGIALIVKPTIDALDFRVGNFSTVLENKLNGIAAGAEVNVNADWNAVAGDAQILNKPTLGTSSSLNVAASGNASSGEVVKGDDTRLSDARTPTAHTHTVGDIVSVPTASLIGRFSVGTGVAESISLGANLSLSAGVLSATGGLSVSSLQNAYDNSTTPEILTDPSRGAVDFRRGSASDNDNVIAVQNNAGSTNFAVTGNGAVTGSTFNGVALTTAGSSSLVLNAAGSYSSITPVLNWTNYVRKEYYYIDMFNNSAVYLSRYFNFINNSGSNSTATQSYQGDREGIFTYTSGAAAGTGGHLYLDVTNFSTNKTFTSRVGFYIRSEAAAALKLSIGTGVTWNNVAPTNWCVALIEGTTFKGQYKQGASITDTATFALSHSTWYSLETVFNATTKVCVFNIYNGDTGALLHTTSLTGVTVLMNGWGLSLTNGTTAAVTTLASVDYAYIEIDGVRY